MIMPIIFLMTLSVFANDLDQAINYYQNRYQQPDLYSKIVNNTGDGFEELYGTRNVRAVLKGVLFRGGANNYYHRSNRRNNMNPLPQDGLDNLCKENFNQAIYLYSTNAQTAPTQINCERRENGKNTLNYKSIVPLANTNSLKPIFQLVYNQIHHYEGPIYIHCWNGWHASGYTAATALMQFCDFSANRAVEYWDLNTDGVNQDPQYENIRIKIRAFKPYPELLISKELQDKICF